MTSSSGVSSRLGASMSEPGSNGVPGMTWGRSTATARAKVKPVLPPSRPARSGEERQRRTRERTVFCA